MFQTGQPLSARGSSNWFACRSPPAGSASSNWFAWLLSPLAPWSSLSLLASRTHKHPDRPPALNPTTSAHGTATSSGGLLRELVVATSAFGFVLTVCCGVFGALRLNLLQDRARALCSCDCKGNVEMGTRVRLGKNGFKVGSKSFRGGFDAVSQLPGEECQANSKPPRVHFEPTLETHRRSQCKVPLLMRPLQPHELCIDPLSAARPRSNQPRCT
jgi:hypothetical protein